MDTQERDATQRARRIHQLLAELERIEKEAARPAISTVALTSLLNKADDIRRNLVQLEVH